MKLNISHSIHTKVSQKNNVWRSKKRYGLKKLCEIKGVELIDGRVCSNHIHMYVAIPPKFSVSEFMLYLKGKSALMIFDRHPEYRTKWGDRHFWARGYYVGTVGNINE